MVRDFLRVCGDPPGDALAVEQAALADGFTATPSAFVDAARSAYHSDLIGGFLKADGSPPVVWVPLAVEREHFDHPSLVCGYEILVGDADAIRAELNATMDDDFPYGIGSSSSGTVYSWTANSIAPDTIVYLNDKGELSGAILSLTSPIRN